MIMQVGAWHGRGRVLKRGLSIKVLVVRHEAFNSGLVQDAFVCLNIHSETRTSYVWLPANSGQIKSKLGERQHLVKVSKMKINPCQLGVFVRPHAPPPQ